MFPQLPMGRLLPEPRAHSWPATRQLLTPRRDPFPRGEWGAPASVPGLGLSSPARVGCVSRADPLSEGAIKCFSHGFLASINSPGSGDSLMKCKWLLVALFHF